MVSAKNFCPDTTLIPKQNGIRVEILNGYHPDTILIPFQKKKIPYQTSLETWRNLILFWCFPILLFSWRLSSGEQGVGFKLWWVANNPMAEVAETQPSSLVQAEASEESAVCQKCKQEITDLEQVAAVKHVSQSKKVLCKGCHNVQRMLFKHGVGQEVFEGMSSGEQTSFFQRCLKARNENGVLKYKLVRSELKDSMVKRSVETFSQGTLGKFQPIDYYEKKGYDTDRIKRLAPSVEHPVLGTTYRVDIAQISWSQAEEQAEQTLIEAERKVIRKRTAQEELAAAAPKRGKGKKANQQDDSKQEDVKELTDEQKAEEAILIDLIDMDADDCIVPCFCFNSFFWLGFKFVVGVVVTPHEGGFFCGPRSLIQRLQKLLRRRGKRQSWPVRTMPRPRKRTRSSPAWLPKPCHC